MGTITKWDDASGFIYMNTTAVAVPFGGKVEVGGLIGINLNSPIQPGKSGHVEFHDGHTFAWIDNRATVLAAPLNVGDAYLAEDTTTQLGFVIRVAAIGDNCVYYAGKSESAGGGGVTTVQLNTAIANARNFSLVSHSNTITVGTPPTVAQHPSPTVDDVVRILNTATGVIETWKHDGTTWNSIHNQTPGGTGSITKILARANATQNTAPSVLEFPAPALGSHAYILLNDGTREIWDHNGTVWNRSSLVTAPSATSNVQFVVRGNDTLNVAPTAVEFPAPTAGAQSLVRLNDGSSEVWDHNGTAWSRTDLNPGSNVIVVPRAGAAQNIQPTVGEFPNPRNKSQALVRLPDGASELWEHNGTSWVRRDIITGGGGADDATQFVTRITTATGAPSAAELVAAGLDPSEPGDQVLVTSSDGTRSWYQTTLGGPAATSVWTLADQQVIPVEYKEFSQVAHGLVVGDRVYVDAAGNLVKGDSSTGSNIPRMIISSVPDANTVRAIPNGGDWWVDAGGGGTWDITNAATVTNSRHAKTQDSGALGHAAGTLDNVERYFVADVGGDALWILLPGRPVDAGTTSQDPVAVPASGALFTHTTEDNVWFVDPGQAGTPAGAALPTTIDLRAVGDFSQTSHTIIKNASSQTITLSAKAGENIDGFASVTLSPGQAATLRRSVVANTVAAV